MYEYLEYYYYINKYLNIDIVTSPCSLECDLKVVSLNLGY